MAVLIRVRSNPQLNDPTLIGAVPDSGPVAKLVLEYLIHELKAELLAEIFSNYMPPEVVSKPDGSARLARNFLYFWKNPVDKSDLILFTGDSQPLSSEGAFEIIDKVLDISKRHEAKTVYSVGAYVTSTVLTQPRIFMTSTDIDIVNRFRAQGIIPMKTGSVTWMNGILFGLTELKEMKGIYLCGETSTPMIDTSALRASRQLLEVLSSNLGFTLDLDKLYPVRRFAS